MNKQKIKDQIEMCDDFGNFMDEREPLPVRPESAGSVTVRIDVSEILDLADQCDRDGKTGLAKWLRLEAEHHSPNDHVESEETRRKL